jgi:hypothetical protein
MVGDAVGIVADIEPYPVVDAYGKRMFTGGKVRRKCKVVWNGKTFARSDVFIIDPHIGEPVALFQKQLNMFIIPFGTNIDITLIPRRTDVVLVRLKPARDLYITRLTKLFVLR